MPLPDLSGIEAVVREQLTRVHADAEAILRAEGASAAERAEAWGRLGQHYYAYDLSDAAGLCFREASAASPGDFRWLYYQATLWQQAGDLKRSTALYEEVLRLRPNNLAALVRLGEVHLEAGALEQAEARLHQALGVDATSPAALARLGELALARGDHGEAVRRLEQALDRVPEADRLHYPLAMAYRALGDAAQAAAHMEARGRIGVVPPDPLMDALRRLREGERVHLLRGRRAFAAADFEAAREAFQRAVEAEPGSAGARVDLSAALSELGRFDEALAELRRAVVLEPSGATAHFNLALLLARRGERFGAIHHLRLVLAAEPGDGAASLQLARLLGEEGLTDEALAELARARSENPASEAAWLAEAALLARAGRPREALDRLEQAHARWPESGHAAHALARVLAGSPQVQLRDGERALGLAQRVFEAHSSVEHAETVALALAELGRCGEAAGWQRRAVAAVREAGAGEEAGLPRMETTLALYERPGGCRPGGAKR
jgi:tetratricopeptide (TPR) repeat protein